MPRVKESSVQFNLIRFDDAIAKTEKKDCAVRALANILGDYPKAHEIFTVAGRKPKEGTFGFTIHKILMDDELMASLGYKVKKMYQLPYFSENVKNKLTMAKLKKYYPQGKYYATTDRHAFALIDGVIYDSFPSGKCKKIESLYLFIPND
jgi:hypothetical protein